MSFLPHGLWKEVFSSVTSGPRLSCRHLWDGEKPQGAGLGRRGPYGKGKLELREVGGPFKVTQPYSNLRGHIEKATFIKAALGTPSCVTSFPIGFLGALKVGCDLLGLHLHRISTRSPPQEAEGSELGGTLDRPGASVEQDQGRGVAVGCWTLLATCCPA